MLVTWIESTPIHRGVKSLGQTLQEPVSLGWGEPGPLWVKKWQVRKKEIE